MIIVFDSETRQFSAFDETRVYADGKGKAYFKGASTPLAMIGGGIVGGTTGTLVARSKAKKKAAELGLEPGTAEYKQYVRRQGAKGAAIGVAGGAAAGYGIERGAHVLKRRSDVRKNADSYLNERYGKGNGWSSLSSDEKKEWYKSARKADDRKSGNWQLFGDRAARKAAKAAKSATA